jgi:group 1 glycosyl transferase
VRLLGNRSQAEVKNHIRQAAMLIAPSIISADGDRDGLPTILVEAMALGTPCISTNIVGIPELVRDGDTGLLAPPNDPSALADTIARLLNDPALAVRLATNARALIERDYNIHANTAQLREHIRASIAGQK